MKTIFYLLVVPLISDSKAAWKSLGNYDYYFDEREVITSFSEAVKKCKGLSATLVTVKTKEIEDFILQLPGPGK